jgi:hypothetical protein
MFGTTVLRAVLQLELDQEVQFVTRENTAADSAVEKVSEKHNALEGTFGIAKVQRRQVWF